MMNYWKRFLLTSTKSKSVSSNLQTTHTVFSDESRISQCLQFMYMEQMHFI